MVATFQLAQQTARWCRFARVTVEVTSWPRHEVIVAPDAGENAARRAEAECGARQALGYLSAGTGGRRVMVTGILATDTDTGVGDVHEATARAVWQAVGVIPQRAYAGFSEPDLVAAWLRDRIGLRLLTVTEARHWHRGRREPDMDSLLHAWLHFESRPPVQVHGLGDELLLHTGDPYPPCDMGEHGEIRVGSAAAPDLLAGLVGARLVNAAVILESSADSVCAGLLLRLDTADVMIGAFCDEWVVATGELPPQVQPSWSIRPWVHPA